MSQTKLLSFIEAWANTVVGFVVAFITQVLVFPMYDVHISMAQDFQIVVIFSVVSIIRSYLLRRAFNKFGMRKSK